MVVRYSSQGGPVGIGGVVIRLTRARPRTHKCNAIFSFACTAAGLGLPRVIKFCLAGRYARACRTLSHTIASKPPRRCCINEKRYFSNYDIATRDIRAYNSTKALLFSPRAMHSPAIGYARLHPSKPTRAITKIAIIV